MDQVDGSGGRDQQHLLGSAPGDGGALVRRQEGGRSIELGGGGVPAGDVNEPPPRPSLLLRTHRRQPTVLGPLPAGNTQLPRPAASSSTALAGYPLERRSEEMGTAQPKLYNGSEGLSLLAPAWWTEEGFSSIKPMDRGPNPTRRMEG